MFFPAKRKPDVHHGDVIPELKERLVNDRSVDKEVGLVLNQQ